MSQIVIACCNEANLSWFFGINSCPTKPLKPVPAIAFIIAGSGFNGFVGQEFIPKNQDKLASLQQAITICDI